MLSKRMTKIDSSGIRKVFDLAQNMRDPINLSIGQPDFDVLPKVKQEALKAIQEGFNRYTVSAGIPELRQAVMERYQNKGYSAEASMVTSGVSGGILLALLATVDPGDEIIVPDPYFVMYKHLVRFIGAEPKFVNTYPDFRLRENLLEESVTERTKAIFVNSPANPTSAVLSDEDIQMVAKFAQRHNLLVISDEIYDTFNYLGESSCIGEYYSNTLVLNGFSKSAAMTGWRVGYALGPDELIQAMTQIQQYTFVCAPSFAQKAALAALGEDTEPVRERYRRKRDLIYNGLKDCFEVEKPEGAFYIFPRVPQGKGTDEEFVKSAIANNLLCIPGSVFSQQNTHFRLSFAATDETIQQGVEVLCRIAQ